jgi:hypothetical protein
MYVDQGIFRSGHVTTAFYQGMSRHFDNVPFSPR